MKSVTLVMAILFVALSAVAHAQNNESNSAEPGYTSNYNCDSDTQQGYAYKYCIRNVDRTKNQDIIYFFHGLNGNEETWFTQTFGTGMVERKWHFRGYDPTIITISFGDVWLLVNNHRFPLLPLFKDYMMPFLEGKVGGLGKGRRMIIGQSMGGFNAIEAAMEYPSTFSKVLLMCPAITTVGPFDSQTDIQSYITRTGARPSLVKLMLGISKQVFINDLDWQRHDPLKRIATYKGPKPAIYVSTGMKDDFGFQEGSEQFATIAKKRGFKSQWVPVPGGHCNFDRRTSANFIMEGYQ